SEDNSEFAAAYTYDELGRLISATEPDSTTKTYTYDIAGNRISYTLKVSNVTQLSTTYTYDYFNRLETVSENGVLVATYTYDINGNRASLVYANGTSEHYTYNLANMVTSVVNKSGNIVISSYSYTYYLDGNQRTKTDHSGEVTTYTYDGIGRLISEVLTVSNVVTESYSYTYDFAHNRLSMLVENSSGAIVTSYLYDLNNRLIKETKGSSVITRYSYDDNGNQILKYYQTLQSSSNTPSSLALTTHGLDTFTYNGLNQLIAVNIGDVEAEYAYKSNGLRIAKTVDGITTKAIWDGSNISLELDDNSSVIAKYIRGLNLLASETSSGRIYYLYNAHGDISQLTDVLGAIVASYSYDAFGNEKSPDPNDLNPFRYCSEYYDTETGNYYLRARYMAPVIGRFISEDTHWNTRNMVYGDNSEGKPSDVIQQQIAYILKKQAIVAKVASDIYTYACWSSDLKILNATRWNLGQLTENEQQALEQVINKIRYVSLEAIIQSGNLYVYCANSPVIFNDATGLWFTRAIISVASGVIFGAIGYNIGKAMSLTGSELTFFTTAFVALGVTIGLVFGVQILTTINNLIKPLLYFFSNPGQLYFGLKILNFVQFEVHAPHHDKPIHFVVRLFVNGGQIAWEWWFGK
ncbi:MAG: hypothetical protein FWC25_01045, partial [Dehalococcoidia bacterium]|nr:hypothetical protein [Dehalococcoidia bacterium]